MSTGYEIEGNWYGKDFDRVLNGELPVDSYDSFHTTALMFAAETGAFDAVKKLIDMGADVNACDEGGNTPLICAAKGNVLSIIRLLLEAGADQNACIDKSDTAMSICLERGNFAAASLLFQRKFSIPRTASCTLLKRAAEHKDTSFLKFLLKHIDVNVKDTRGETALFTDCLSIEAAQVLINAGIDVNAVNEDGRNCLISSQRGDVVKVLLEAGVDPNVGQSWKGGSDIIAVESCLIAGANVNATDEEETLEYTALMTHCGGYDITERICKVYLLLKAGANPNIEALDDMPHFEKATALNWALYNKAPELVIRMLLKAGAKPEENMFTDYRAVVQKALLKNNESNPMTEAKQIFEREKEKLLKKWKEEDEQEETDEPNPYDADEDEIDDDEDFSDEDETEEDEYIDADEEFSDDEEIDDYTSDDWFNAINCNKKSLIKAMIKSGFDVNATQEFKLTALHYPVTLEIAECLILAGANIEAKTEHGQTPLHAARSPEVVECLIKTGANVEAKDNDGRTPLHAARSSEVVECLIKAGANIEAKDNYGITPLMLASRISGNEQIVARLIESGAKINVKDEDGDTALQYVMNEECAKLLIDAGADIHTKNANNESVLENAACAECAQLFINLGLDVNEKDDDGDTPLTACAACRFKDNPEGELETLQVLLNAGADVDAANDEGYTALMYIAELSSLKRPIKFVKKALELLIENGADANKRNRKGHSALSIAQKIGNQEVISILGK